MAAHAYLKNEFMEDEKCQNLMSWLVYSLLFKDHNGNKGNHFLFFVLSLVLVSKP